MTIDIHNTPYRVSGPDQGYPMVLINAFPVDHRMWDRCGREIVRMSEERGMDPFAVWAPDMPGSGDSPVPDDHDTGNMADDGSYPDALDNLTDAYARLVSDAGFSGAIWVGLSMGGYVAADMQRRHPDMVEGLALCDTRVGVDPPRARQGRLDCASSALARHDVSPVRHFAEPKEGDSTVKRSQDFIVPFSEWIAEQTPEGIAWRQRMAAGRDDLTDQLGSVTAPAAIVVGDRDPSSSVDSMRSMAAAMTSTSCAFTVVEDCGHFSAFEHPRTVAGVLVDLAERVNG